MTDEEYFSSKYANYISNSKLALINPAQGGSPELYKTGFQGGFNDSFDLGSAVHGLLLQPEEFEVPALNKPTGKLGLFAIDVFKYRQEGKTIQESFDLAKVSADYYQKGFSDKRQKTAIEKSIEFYLGRMKFVEDPVKVPLFLSKPNADKCEECVGNVLKSRAIMRHLRPTGMIEDPEVFNEYAIFGDLDIYDDETDETIPVKIKAKIDSFSVDHEEQVITLNDLKTTGRPLNFFMGKYIYTEAGQVWANGSFEKYHYYRQAAFYVWLLQAALKPKYPNYTFRVNFLVVETTPNFNCDVFRIQDKWIEAGLKEMKELIILVANEQRSK